jgi:uncharacterized protein (UPF0276 family)
MGVSPQSLQPDADAPRRQQRVRELAESASMRMVHRRTSADRVAEIHLAGHVALAQAIDDHGSQVCDAVWHCTARRDRFGALPTLTNGGYQYSGL